jgi:hypothetical protein
MNFSCAYFGSFSCINAYIFKKLLGHKNPVPNNALQYILRHLAPYWQTEQSDVRLLFCIQDTNFNFFVCNRITH